MKNIFKNSFNKKIIEEKQNKLMKYCFIILIPLFIGFFYVSNKYQNQFIYNNSLTKKLSINNVKDLKNKINTINNKITENNNQIKKLNKNNDKDKIQKLENYNHILKEARAYYAKNLDRVKSN